MVTLYLARKSGHGGVLRNEGSSLTALERKVRCSARGYRETQRRNPPGAGPEDITRGVPERGLNEYQSPSADRSLRSRRLMRTLGPRGKAK
jgi:hypothetical protein